MSVGKAKKHICSGIRRQQEKAMERQPLPAIPQSLPPIHGFPGKPPKLPKRQTSTGDDDGNRNNDETNFNHGAPVLPKKRPSLVIDDDTADLGCIEESCEIDDVDEDNIKGSSSNKTRLENDSLATTTPRRPKQQRKNNRKVRFGVAEVKEFERCTREERKHVWYTKREIRTSLESEIEAVWRGMTRSGGGKSTKVTKDIEETNYTSRGLEEDNVEKANRVMAYVAAVLCRYATLKCKKRNANNYQLDEKLSSFCKKKSKTDVETARKRGAEDAIAVVDTLSSIQRKGFLSKMRKRIPHHNNHQSGLMVVNRWS